MVLVYQRSSISSPLSHSISALIPSGVVCRRNPGGGEMSWSARSPGDMGGDIFMTATKKDMMSFSPPLYSRNFFYFLFSILWFFDEVILVSFAEMTKTVNFGIDRFLLLRECWAPILCLGNLGRTRWKILEREGEKRKLGRINKIPSLDYFPWEFLVSFFSPFFPWSAHCWGKPEVGDPSPLLTLVPVSLFYTYICFSLMLISWISRRKEGVFG